MKVDFQQDAGELLNKLRTRPEAEWQQAGREMVIELGERMANEVPAYGDFLQAHGAQIEGSFDWERVEQLPLTSKDNYLRRHDLPELTWGGRLSEVAQVISATSGSTGQPFYFPRQQEQDEQYALTAELYLLSNFAIDQRRTLYVVAFPMGVWIGGVFTYEAVTEVARKGDYPLSVVTAGINKQAVIDVVQRLGGYYDQVLIGAYGPFLKDILDEGERQGVDWAAYNLGFIFSAEGFSEEFRQYVYEKAGVVDYYRGSLNHYGTVDLGTMAHETPLAILIRQVVNERPEVRQRLFGQIDRLPTLCQYVPEMFYFEQVERRVVCSARSGLPLLRYDLQDVGGVIGLSEMEAVLREYDLDLWQLVEEAGIAETVWQLPFVYVFERDDFSVRFYAFQLYPEAVRRGLQSNELTEVVTGKFAMEVVMDERQNQKLQVHVEMQPGVEFSQELLEQVVACLTAGLRRYSSEYAKVYEEYGDQVAPVVMMVSYGDDRYFGSGGKQKWVIK